MNKGHNYYGRGSGYGNKFGMGGGDPAGREDNRMPVWEATRMLQEGYLLQGADLPRMLELAHNLSQYLENTRTMYNQAVSERDAAQRRLQNANNKLSHVENLVKRFAAVRDPVIASDGYTYEHESITKYLEECSSGNSKAYSQQTKEELTDVTVPNRSLNRLVTHLKEVRPLEVPPTSHRGSIPALPSSMTQRAAWGPEDMDGAAGVGPMPVQPLDASMPPEGASITPLGSVPAPRTAAAGGSGGFVPRSSAPAFTAGTSIGGITVPAPASASHGGAGRGNRFDGGRGRGVGGRPELHPCLRVFGFCNFMDDCTFANYPFEACLNHIKGKCRFGANCKELHVDPRDPRYQNARSYANQHNHNNQNQNNQAQQQQSATKDAEEAAENKSQEQAASAAAEQKSEDVTEKKEKADNNKADAEDRKDGGAEPAEEPSPETAEE